MERKKYKLVDINERMSRFGYNNDQIRAYIKAIRERDEETIDSLPCKCRPGITCPPCSVNYLRETFDGFKLKNSGRTREKLN
jgi:hypothetical protein